MDDDFPTQESVFSAIVEAVILAIGLLALACAVSPIYFL